MLLLHFRWTKGLHEFLPLTQDWPHTLKNASKILPKSEGSLSYFHHYIPCQEASFTMFTFYNCCSNSRKWVGEKRSHKNCFIDLYKVYNILKNFKVTLFEIKTFGPKSQLLGKIINQWIWFFELNLTENLAKIKNFCPKIQTKIRLLMWNLPHSLFIGSFR